MRRASWLVLGALWAASAGRYAAACVEVVAEGLVIDSVLDDCVLVTDGASLDVVSGGRVSGRVDVELSSRCRLLGGAVDGRTSLFADAVLEVHSGACGGVDASDGSKVNVAGGATGGVGLLFASTLDVTDGAVGAVEGEASDVRIGGGDVAGICAGFDTVVMVSAGSVGGMVAGEHGSVLFLGGGMVGRIDLLMLGSADISGGIVVGDVSVADSAEATMRGGVVRGTLEVREGGFARVSGGTIETGIANDGTVDVLGTDLALSPNPLLGGVITGALADGTPLTGLAYRGSGALLFNGAPPLAATIAVVGDEEIGGCGLPSARVVVTHSCALDALTLAVAHDPDVARAVGARPSGLAAALRGGLGPELVTVDLDPVAAECAPGARAGVIVSMVFSLADPASHAIAAGTDHEVATIAYAAAPGAAPGALAGLELVDCLRSRVDAEPTPNLLSCRGSRVVPVKVSGRLRLVSPCFARGDCNGDGAFNITDPILLLNHLYVTGEPIECRDACDSDDNGRFEISDPVRALQRLFIGGDALPAPFWPECGGDPTADPLPCGATTAGCVL